MATEIDDLLKTLRKDKMSKGMQALVTLNAADLEVQKQSNTYQSDLLGEIVDSKVYLAKTEDRLDTGIGKIISIIQRAQDMAEIPPIPNDNDQDMLQLTRGLLAQTSAIRGIMEEMKKDREKMADRKTWTNPAEDTKTGPRVKLKDRSHEKGILATLGDIGRWAMAPVFAVAAYLSKSWQKMKTKMLEKLSGVKTKLTGWFDDFILRSKTFIDDAVKGIAKRFPKITSFLKTVGGFFKRIFSTGVGKWVGKGLKLFAKLGGQIVSGIAKLGLKIAGKLIAPIVAIYDFFDGWFNADKITGIAKDSLSIWDKMSAGLASILSSLTLGFVSAQDWYEVIFGDHGIVDLVKGFFIDIWNMLPNGIQEAAKGIWDGLSILTDFVSSQFKSFFGVTITEKIEKILDDIAAWVDTNISWDKLKPSWLPSFGGDDVDEKNAEWEKKQRNKSPIMLEQSQVKTVAKNLDTSAKVLSDKKALKDAQANLTPLVIQAPAPNVIVPGSEFMPSAFEGDMFMQLIGQ